MRKGTFLGIGALASNALPPWASLSSPAKWGSWNPLGDQLTQWASALGAPAGKSGSDSWLCPMSGSSHLSPLLSCTKWIVTAPSLGPYEVFVKCSPLISCSKSSAYSPVVIVTQKPCQH